RIEEYFEPLRARASSHPPEYHAQVMFLSLRRLPIVGTLLASIGGRKLSNGDLGSLGWGPSCANMVFTAYPCGESRSVRITPVNPSWEMWTSTNFAVIPSGGTPS